MSETLKILYTPSETKRYEISQDPISRERARVVHHILRDVHKQHPFLVGGVLFGSLTKGKPLDEISAFRSDIDLVLFVDFDKVHVGSDGLTDENEDWKEDWEIQTEISSMSYGMSEEHNIEQAVSLYLRDLVVGRLYREIDVSHSLPVGLGGGIYTRRVGLLGKDSIGESMGHVKRYLLSLDRDEVKGDLERKSKESTVQQVSSIALPWMMDLVGGMKTYRKSFLVDYLGSQNEEQREAQWNIINHAVRTFERSGDVNDKIANSFPATYEEALRYYLPHRK